MRKNTVNGVIDWCLCIDARAHAQSIDNPIGRRYSDCLVISYAEYNKKHGLRDDDTKELCLVDAALMAKRAEMSKGNAEIRREGWSDPVNCINQSIESVYKEVRMPVKTVAEQKEILAMWRQSRGGRPCRFGDIGWLNSLPHFEKYVLVVSCWHTSAPALQVADTTVDPVEFHYGVRGDRRAKLVPLYLLYVGGHFVACRLNILQRCLDRTKCKLCMHYHYKSRKCVERKSECTLCKFDICWLSVLSEAQLSRRQEQEQRC